MLMKLDPPLPDWVIPPHEGFKAEDLDRLQGLPPHTELIDGSLVFVSPQALFHVLVIDLLNTGLRAAAPSDMRVRREMTVTLGPRQRPEPDVTVVRRTTRGDLASTDLLLSDVVLAVEVVSPESQVRDRERKPQLYAEAGIRHFWRIENDGDAPVAYVFELDPATGAYSPTGIHRGVLKVALPFPVEIDFSEIEDY